MLLVFTLLCILCSSGASLRMLVGCPQHGWLAGGCHGNVHFWQSLEGWSCLSSRDHTQLHCPLRVLMGTNICKSWVQPFCATQREVGSWENHVLLREISAAPSTKLQE